MAHASLFHWLRREDVEPVNLSIGLWQVSRVHAVIGEGVEAARYAEECVALSGDNNLPPFYIGYGHEAAARAASLCGEDEKLAHHLNAAEVLAEKIEDAGEKEALSADLQELKANPPHSSNPRAEAATSPSSSK